jgi:hypothetical protein
MALVVLTLYILDMFNPGMDLIGNGIFKIILAVFCVATLATSFYLVIENRRNS